MTTVFTPDHADYFNELGYTNLKLSGYSIPAFDYGKKLVNFKDIGWKGKDKNHSLVKERYNAADIGYPCILTKGQNPYNCKYRMIDGKHRITKMKNMGIEESIFYIVDFDIFFKLLQP